MKKVNLFFSVLITVFLLAIWGCGDSDDGEAGMAGCGEDALCVGVLIPDPSLENFAEGIGDAARKAETDIASAGGNIELHFKEVGDCNDFSVPRTAAKELVDMGVDAIVGHICSGVSNSILGGGDEAAVSGIENVIMISPANTAAVFSTDKSIYDYYFRTAPSDVNQAALLAREIQNTSTAQTQTYVVYRNDIWGQLFNKGLLDNGVSASGMTMEYDREEKDTIAGTVEEFLGGHGDINVAVIAFNEAEDILKTLLSSENISKNNRYYLNDGYYAEIEKLKDELEGLGQSGDLENPKTLAQLFHSNSSGFLATSTDSYKYEDDMELADAQEKFKSRYEGDYAPNTYDAVVLLALAYLSAGSSEPDALARALVEVSGPPGRCTSYEKCAMQIQNEDADINYEGLSGTIDFDEKGDIAVAVYKILSYFDRTINERRNVSAP